MTEEMAGRDLSAAESFSDMPAGKEETWKDSSVSRLPELCPIALFMRHPLREFRLLIREFV